MRGFSKLIHNRAVRKALEHFRDHPEELEGTELPIPEGMTVAEVFSKILEHPVAFSTLVSYSEATLAARVTVDSSLLERVRSNLQNMFQYLMEHKWEILEWALKILPLVILFMQPKQEPLESEGNKDGGTFFPTVADGPDAPSESDGGSGGFSMGGQDGGGVE